MDYFGKPTAYKNVAASQYRILSVNQKQTQKQIENLLDQISSYSPKDSSCTCS